MKKLEKSRICKLVLAVSLMLAACFCLSGSSTKTQAASTYQIKINKQQNCVTIYKLGAGGKYKPVKAMVCSTGYATQTGSYSLGSKMRWHTLDGPCYGQYCTRIYGGVLFHSVWYTGYNNPATLSASSYNKLGTTASHGCVRLTVADAKWIYDNVPSGSSVIIYNSSNPGPLGKPAAIKIPYSSGWDPTDIWNASNPWNKKKPAIYGAKSQKIPYNSRFDVKKGVTGKNTTGYDATGRIKVKIKYRGSVVKRIDTRRPGTYQVTYQLVDEIGRKARKVVKVTVTGSLPVPKIKNVEDIYVNSADKLTKGRALRDCVVTQKGKALDRKYITVTYKKLKKNVYRVIYEAQNASETARATAKAYVDKEAPKIEGVQDGGSYPVADNTVVNEEYARSLIHVSDNLSKLSVRNVEVKITREDSGYRIVYTVKDQAGNKRKVTIHLVPGPAQPASGTAVS